MAINVEAAEQGSVEVHHDATHEGTGYALAAYEWRKNVRDAVWLSQEVTPTLEQKLAAYTFLAIEANAEAAAMYPFHTVEEVR